jgi:hypothetical protein
MKCSALNKNCHPCRGFARDTSPPLCYIHDGFYNRPQCLFDIVKQNAFNLQHNHEIDWCVATMRSIREQDDKLREAFRADIRERLVKMFEDRFTEPNQITRAANMYRVFLKGGLIDPLDIKPLWKHCVQKRLTLYHFCYVESRLGPERHPLILEESALYFKGGRRGSVYMAAYLLTLRAKLLSGFDAETLTGDFKRRTDEAWKGFFSFAIKQMNMQAFVGTDVGALLGPLLKTCASEKELADFIVETIRERTAIFKEQVALRVQPFKEGIAAAAFKPERVWAALEAGLEIEDL